MTSKEFLSGLENENADLRYAAWSKAAEVDAKVIPSLGRLLAANNPGVRKAANEALNTIVHSVGKEAEGGKRKTVVRGLLKLLDDNQPQDVRVIALRQLSLLAGDDAVADVAKLVRQPQLQEEAVFCLERIPGKVATMALLNSLKDAKDEFKPRLLAALGHRRALEAVEVCAAAMGSANTDVAMAGMKTLARIGEKPDSQQQPPPYESLSDWQKVEFADSMLRYADAQVEQGNVDDALKAYKRALGQAEEHWQCAAIIGLAKIGTAEAAAAIFPKLSSGANTVRITAAKAWGEMKDNAVRKGSTPR
jgi:HEAT repeat protein